MRCKKCGQEISDSAKFCPDCGAPVETSKKKTKKPIYKRWWFWLIVVWLVFAIIGSFAPPAESPTEETIPLQTTEENIPSSISTSVATTPVTEAPATEAPETTAPDDGASTGEKNALRSAISYLNFSAFSYSGLIDQLKYEGYTAEEATYAVDHCGADWTEQALKSAKSYLEFSAFSYPGLIEQLEYEGFSTEDATNAADNCGADWFEQAAKSAESYLEFSSFSRAGLIEQLEYEGFTNEQAVYGVEQNGY